MQIITNLSIYKLIKHTFRSFPTRIRNCGKVDGPGLRIIRILLGGEIQWRRWLDGSWITLFNREEI